MQTQIHLFKYVDGKSAGQNAYLDFQIGRDARACGSNKARGLVPGDIAIICAPRGKQKNVIFGRIVEDLGENLPIWHDHGGEYWKYNYRYEPITHQMTEEDTYDLHMLRELCADKGLNYAQLYNPSHLAGGPFKNKFREVILEYLNITRFRV